MTFKYQKVSGVADRKCGVVVELSTIVSAIKVFSAIFVGDFYASKVS